MRKPLLLKKIDDTESQRIIRPDHREIGFDFLWQSASKPGRFSAADPGMHRTGE